MGPPRADEHPGKEVGNREGIHSRGRVFLCKLVFFGCVGWEGGLGASFWLFGEGWRYWFGGGCLERPFGYRVEINHRPDRANT